MRAIVCLAEKDELYEKSPDYARALDAVMAPCGVLPFEIPDRGAQPVSGAGVTVEGIKADRLVF